MHGWALPTKPQIGYDLSHIGKACLNWAQENAECWLGWLFAFWVGFARKQNILPCSTLCRYITVQNKTVITGQRLYTYTPNTYTYTHTHIYIYIYIILKWILVATLLGNHKQLNFTSLATILRKFFLVSTCVGHITFYVSQSLLCVNNIKQFNPCKYIFCVIAKTI